MYLKGDVGASENLEFMGSRDVQAWNEQDDETFRLVGLLSRSLYVGEVGS